MTSVNRISSTGLELIKQFEGFRSRSEPLADDIWIVGYGHTRSARAGVEVSEREAEYLLRYDLVDIENAIKRMIYAPLNQNEFDALVSFAWNIGVDQFRTSNVLNYINAGEMLAAAESFSSWRKANLDGSLIVVDALVRRRAAEKNLFLRHPSGPASISGAVVRPQLDTTASVLALSDGALSREAKLKLTSQPKAGEEPSRITFGAADASDEASPGTEPGSSTDDVPENGILVDSPAAASTVINAFSNRIETSRSEPEAGSPLSTANADAPSHAVTSADASSSSIHASSDLGDFEEASSIGADEISASSGPSQANVISIRRDRTPDAATSDVSEAARRFDRRIEEILGTDDASEPIVSRDSSRNDDSNPPRRQSIPFSFGTGATALAAEMDAGKHAEDETQTTGVIEDTTSDDTGAGEKDVPTPEPEPINDRTGQASQGVLSGDETIDVALPEEISESDGADQPLDTASNDDHPQVAGDIDQHSEIAGSGLSENGDISEPIIEPAVTTTTEDHETDEDRVADFDALETDVDALDEAHVGTASEEAETDGPVDDPYPLEGLDAEDTRHVDEEAEENSYRPGNDYDTEPQTGVFSPLKAHQPVEKKGTSLAALPFGLLALIGLVMVVLGVIDWWNILQSETPIDQNELYAGPFLMLIGGLGLIFGLYFLVRRMMGAPE